MVPLFTCVPPTFLPSLGKSPAPDGQSNRPGKLLQKQSRDEQHRQGRGEEAAAQGDACPRYNSWWLGVGRAVIEIAAAAAAIEH